MNRFVYRVVLVTALLAITALPASAQTPTPNEINAVARELWCPLCNGVRLDNCELQACVQMREVIAEKLMAGETKDQIKAYFVQQYGDVVLGQPSAEGFNLVVWIFPILAAVVGLGWVGYLIYTWQQRRPAPQPVASSPTTPDDDYLKRVEQELQRFE